MHRDGECESARGTMGWQSIIFRSWGAPCPKTRHVWVSLPRKAGGESWLYCTGGREDPQLRLYSGDITCALPTPTASANSGASKDTSLPGISLFHSLGMNTPRAISPRSPKFCQVSWPKDAETGGGRSACLASPGTCYLRVVEALGSDTSRWASGVEVLKGLEELWPDEGTVPALGGSPSSFSCLACDATLGICREESDWTDRSPAPLARRPDRSILAWLKSPPAESRLSTVRRVSVGRLGFMPSEWRWELGLAARGLGEKLPGDAIF